MVSNFERILAEIRKEAHQIAQDYGLQPEAVVTLIMDIVDLEDKNRIKAVGSINKKVRIMIENAAQAGDSKEGI